MIYAWLVFCLQTCNTTGNLIRYLHNYFMDLQTFVLSHGSTYGYAQVAFVVIVLCGISLYATVIAQAIHLYRETPALSSTKKVQDRLIPYSNYRVIYACWLTVATQLNFVILLVYYCGVDATTGGTVGLLIFLVVIVVYYILENTILDRFARFVFVVYPLFIWAFSVSTLGSGRGQSKLDLYCCVAGVVHSAVHCQDHSMDCLCICTSAGCPKT